MSLQTEFMRITDQRVISVVKRDNGRYSGIEMVNHPTPSGCDRWLITYSDKRDWPDQKTAMEEFKKILPEPIFKSDKKQQQTEE